MKYWVLALALAGWFGAAPALGDDDHERAREALERGDILPLTEILETIRLTYPGHVLETEFEREDGGYRYELELLDDDGYILEIEVDATTGDILEVEREDD